MIRFVLADLGTRRLGALLLVLIIAFATGLGVLVTLQERALRLGSARAAAAFDLVVGAPGSETQLVLSAVFLQPAPLTLVPGEVMARLSADPRVAFAAPVGFGDFAGASPIVGTTTAMLRALGGLRAGHGLEQLSDAVVGAKVPHALGDTLVPMHGQIEAGGHVHAGIAYHVVGQLAPTGTPWDRAVLVPIQAVWQVHEHEHEHEHGVGAGAADDDDDDEAHAPLAGPVDEAAARRADAPGVPAIVVKPVSIAAAYSLRQSFRGHGTLAVFPGEVLARLYGTMGDARKVLALVAAGAQGLVGAAILLVVMAEVMQRRRQIGALRAFGAARGAVFALVWMESFLLLALGVVAGVGVGTAGAWALSAGLERQAGIALPVELAGGDLLQAGLLLALGAGAALLPAVLAYRQSPAEVLRG